MSRAKALTRGDRRRNERLVRLRSIVRRDYAIVAVDLASAKQAAVVADHDSIVLGRRMFRGDAWVIDDILAGPNRSLPQRDSRVWYSAASRPGIGGSRCWTAHAHVSGSWCA